MPHRGASGIDPCAKTVRIVHVEDCLDDAELVSLHLLAADFVLDYRRVDDEAQLMAALRVAEPDLVLSDFNLPGFSGGRALTLVRMHAPGVPFVFLTGSAEPQSLPLGTAPQPDAIVSKDNLAGLPALLRRLLAVAQEGLLIQQT